MHYHSSSFLIALGCDLLLGVAVFLANPRRPANASFLIQCIIIGSWLLTRDLAFSSTTAPEAIFWGRVCSAFALLIVPAFELLRTAVAYDEKGWGEIIRRFRFWIISAGIMAVLALTPFYIRDVFFPVIRTPTADIRFPAPLYHRVGGLTILIFFIISLILLVRRMWSDYFGRGAAGLRRVELQFIQLGYLTLVLGSFIISLMPWLLQNPRLILLLPSYTPFCALAYSLIIAYGITSHRILDVRAFLRRALSYLVLFSYAGTIFTVVWFASFWLFERMGVDAEFWPGLTGAFAVVLLATPGHGMLQRVAARIIPPRLNFENAVVRVDEIIQSVSSLPLLLQQFSRTVAEVADTDYVAVVSREGQGFVQSYPKSTPPLTFSPDDSIVQHLIKKGVGELACEDLERHLTDPYRRGLRERMRALGIEVVVSIRRRGELTGLLLLGPRRGGRIYGGPGLTALRVMADQLAVAIDNCRLYTEARRTAAYIQTLVEDLPVGVIAVDSEQRVTVFNREAERILRLPRLDAGHVGDLPGPVSRFLAATIADHTPSRDKDVILHEETNRETRLVVNCLPFAAEEADALAGIEGQAPGAILVLNDRTALRRLEQQIRQNERLASIGTLAAGTAHEIKNPLVSLRVFTQLLPKRYDDPEFRASFHELVGGEINRIEHIVTQLLNYARPTRPALAGLHLHETIESVLRFIEPQASKSKVKLRSDLDAEEDYILGDSNMLRQVFLNLLLNAIQALTDRGGTVTVRTRIEHGFPGDDGDGAEPVITAEILDDGPGIPAEMLPHVFDPFFTTKDNGTGLGLSVTHTIVREHGGTIEASSDPGRGSCFRLRLQIAHQNAPQAALELVG